MSTSVDTAFITQYSADVHEVFQRRGAYLMPAVFHKSGVIGSTASFHKIGKGTATTKARHGTITPMNQTHTAPSTTLADFYAGDWVDKLDEAKTNMDVRKAYASGGAMALGRKVDDQITTTLNTTTSTVITVTVTSYAAIRGGLLTWAEAAWDNDVPNDGNVYAVVTPRFWSQMMTVASFSDADFVGASSLVFTEGPAVGPTAWKDWMNIKWKMQTGLPDAGGASAKGWIWHATAVGYASAAAAGNVAGNGAVAADITWHGDRAAHFVNHLMSGNSVMIDDTGVIEATWNDTTAVVST